MGSFLPPAGLKDFVEFVQVNEHSAAKLNKKVRVFASGPPLVKRCGSHWEAFGLIDSADW